MNPLEILEKGFGWVTLCYPDQSEKVLRTTLNQMIFLKNNIPTPSGKVLYDFDNKEYVSFAGCSLKIVQAEEICTKQSGRTILSYGNKPKLEGVSGFVEDYFK